MPAKDAESEAQDLSAIITLARKRPMNIALVIGKEGLSIAADPRKPPEVMWREARKIGGGSKGGMGVCNVVGKEIQIQFMEDGFPVTLIKSFKQKLRDEGLKYLPVFLTPDGTRLSDGEDEGDEGAEGEAVAGAADQGPSEGEALMQAFDKMADAVAAARLGTDPLSKKAAGLATLFTTTVEGNPRKAAAILDMLSAAVAALPPPGAAAPDPGRGQGLAALEAQVDALLAEFA